MFATWMTNPGILPKLEADLNLISNISRSRPLGQKYIQNINGDQWKVVFWNVWFIIRPPRTYHWYYWDNWVERFVSMSWLFIYIKTLCPVPLNDQYPFNFAKGTGRRV